MILVSMEETKPTVTISCKILDDKVNVSKPRRGLGEKLGGWGKGSRGYTRAKLNHVQGSQAKSIRKAIWAIPCQSTEKKGQRQKVEFF